MQPAQQHIRNVIELDGYLVDDDTGEVLGLAGKEVFTPDTAEKADWVLSKILEEEAQVLALTARLDTIARNLGRLQKQAEDRIAYLRFRFGPQLEQFAREQLEGKKTRTLTLTHGSLGFRRSQGTTRILDMDAAVDYVEQAAPELVQVKKTVTTTALLQVLPRDDEGEPIAPSWVERTGPRDTFHIKTGLR